LAQRCEKTDERKKEKGESIWKSETAVNEFLQSLPVESLAKHNRLKGDIQESFKKPSAPTDVGGRGRNKSS